MTQTPESPRHAPSWKPLDARQRRVLGVLIEKAKTTPAGYPMSVNAIVTGCNQKSNRAPVTDYDDFGVEKALDELRQLGAVSEVDWIGRVAKFKHHAYEWMGVSKAELAVMAELLLRGAQTLGELRARAARMEPIADLAALQPLVDALLERGLMVALTPPGRGQVVSHNLYLAEELAALRAQHGNGAPGAAQRPGAGESPLTAQGLTPILNVSDIAASFAWFAKLGWRKLWEWGEPPTFGAVGSGRCEIFLCQGGQGGRGRSGVPRTFGPDGDETADRGAWMSLWVSDVDAVHRHCVEQGLEITWPPTDMPWGVREMHVRHPDGHVFRIGKRVGEGE